MLKICCMVMCSVALLVLTAGEADAITGNKYREYPEHLRMMYVVGVLEGWGFVSNTIRGSKLKAPEIDSVFGDISRCAAGKMTQGQVVEIVDKWMRENPAKWHEEMPDLVWRAFSEACK
jgi:hypothetical protein